MKLQAREESWKFIGGLCLCKFKFLSLIVQEIFLAFVKWNPKPSKAIITNSKESYFELVIYSTVKDGGFVNLSCYSSRYVKPSLFFVKWNQKSVYQY